MQGHGEKTLLSLSPRHFAGVDVSKLGCSWCCAGAEGTTRGILNPEVSGACKGIRGGKGALEEAVGLGFSPFSLLWGGWFGRVVVCPQPCSLRAWSPARRFMSDVRLSEK